MGSRNYWSKGSENQYLAVEEMFNNAASTNDGRKALIAFVEATRTSPKSVIELQQEYLASFDRSDKSGCEKSAGQGWSYDASAVASGWYGMTPIWKRNSKNRPAEIEKIMRETRRWLALLLASGTDDNPHSCAWYTQCYHLEFEARITWPRSGITNPTEFRVWVFTPENLPRGEGDETPARVMAAAASSGTGSASTGADSFRNSVKTLSEALDRAELEYRDLVKEQDVYRVASIGAAEQLENHLERGQTELRLRELESTISRLDAELDRAAATASQLLPGQIHLYRRTRMAVGSDRGLPLIGGVEVSDLDDVLAAPAREHLLPQPYGDRNHPRGPTAYGVRFRWERRAPVPYIDFEPTNVPKA